MTNSFFIKLLQFLYFCIILSSIAFADGWTEWIDLGDGMMYREFNSPDLQLREWQNVPNEGEYPTEEVGIHAKIYPDGREVWIVADRSQPSIRYRGSSEMAAIVTESQPDWFDPPNPLDEYEDPNQNSGPHSDSGGDDALEEYSDENTNTASASLPNPAFLLIIFFYFSKKHLFFHKK